MIKFWIDIGGTFTDCLAVDDVGQEHYAKILSSGMFLGEMPGEAYRDRLISPPLAGYGTDFFAGYQLDLIDANGHRIASRTVASFADECGLLKIDRPWQSTELMNAQRYALVSGEPAPIVCVRRVLKLPLHQPLPRLEMALGTTRGTNALLTRTGARVGLVITAGFGDLLEIGEQDRPKLFELTIRKPRPLTSAVLEVDERIAANGTVLRRPDRADVVAGLKRLRREGITSLAIVFLHGYQFTQHEQLVAAWAREIGFENISVSHEVAPAIKIVPRAETTVLDAYLNPVVKGYVSDLLNCLGSASRLELMTSYGGLVSAERFSGKDSVLSGPAGGVVGFARVAEQLGIPRAIGFDMGGTSTDVARYDGHFDLEFESRKANVRIAAPLMAIETVAAGGGSICDFNGVQLLVGPASAGADPGPACYGRGGPLTITDVNLLLGYVSEKQFPFPLDRLAAENQLASLRKRVVEHTGIDYEPLPLAAGLREIANRNMASAVHAVSVARGFDPGGDTLVAFGGAGPQHALQVAEILGIKQVLIHPRGSILSAVGIRLADRSVHRSRPIMMLANANAWRTVAEAHQQLSEELLADMRRDWPDAQALEFRPSVSLRYEGTEPFLHIAQPADGNYVRQFEATHEQMYGYRPARAIEIVAARMEVVLRGERWPSHGPAPRTPTPMPQDMALSWFDDRLHPTACWKWESLPPGCQVCGPALIVDPMTTVVVDPGWKAEVWPHRQLLLKRDGEAGWKKREVADSVDYKVPDPVQLELFNHRFASIAKEMGLTLQRTAVSVNIRDRLDFSCAIFSPTGDLIVNAPHIPVHLGAMSETVRQIIADNPVVARGDAFVTNDPFRGGSHLPDITVVTPVFTADDERPAFWVASRGHHAEIGGKTPGSMPPDARSLADEGILISGFKLIDRGRDQFDLLESLLTSGPYPSRAVADNLADIRAQLAANKRGCDRLIEWVAEQSLPRVNAYMKFVLDAAEQRIRAALRAFPDGRYQFRDQMDSGATIAVSLEKTGDRLQLDFAGTSPVQLDNLNANRAIVLSAVLYVMRCMMDSDIPLNQGVLRPVALRLPECFLNPSHGPDAAHCPAVVGGNVETSQRIVDCLLGALGLAAASQGTMNNWLMGNEHFGYYETLGGGSGATPQGAGADAIHCHMSNTRLTDAEVLETRYPVRLRRMAIRRGSGGRGRHRGGDGMIREIEFLSQVTVSLLTSRRQTAPYGLSGGENGAPGINRLIRANGESTSLPFRTQFIARPHDRLIIETPGGGAWGTPAS